MDGSKRPARTGRYVPFNLSSLAPFESTAAALSELPLLHSISPAPTSEANARNRHLGGHSSPKKGVSKSMLDMMVDTANHRYVTPSLYPFHMRFFLFIFHSEKLISTLPGRTYMYIHTSSSTNSSSISTPQLLDFYSGRTVRF